MFKLLAVATLLAAAAGTAKADSKLSTKVLSGQDAKLGELPHQVSLHLVESVEIMTVNLTAGHLCGGSIISPSTILTSGHCIFDERLRLTAMEIWAGFISQKNPGPTLQRRAVIDKIVHPFYVFRGLSEQLKGPVPNDLAVVILESPFEINEYVAPIALPTEDNEYEGIATVSGWGSNSTSAYTIDDVLHSYPDLLQRSDLPILSFDTCSKVVGKSFNEAMICTGPLNSTKHGVCGGDSGDPVIQDKVLIGVATWSDMLPCGNEESITAYTKTASYRQWIKDNTV